MSISESGNLQEQSNGQSNGLERVDKIVRQGQFIEKEIDNQITRVVDSAVMAVENRMHDAVLTAIDNVIIPRVEMAVKLITGWAGKETNSEVQNPERRDFLGKFSNTRLMSASSRLDLDNE